MSVLVGPRRELRRIVFGGYPQWVTPSDDGSELILPGGRRVEEATAVYLPPCDPTKIICIHLNYDSRRVEFRAPALSEPTYFQKPPTAMNSHRGMLYRPADCQFINYEGEIAAIVGRPMTDVALDDVILTGTPANSRPMQLGDVVEVEVTGVGRLSNTVAEKPAPSSKVGHQPHDTDAIRRVALGGDWWAARDAEHNAANPGGVK